MSQLSAHTFAASVFQHRGGFSLFHSQEMLPVQLFQLIGGVVCAVLAVDDIARHAPAPAVFADHAVHGAVDFRLSIHNLTPFSAAKVFIFW